MLHIKRAIDKMRINRLTGIPMLSFTLPLRYPKNSLPWLNDLLFVLSQAAWVWHQLRQFSKRQEIMSIKTNITMSYTDLISSITLCKCHPLTKAPILSWQQRRKMLQCYMVKPPIWFALWWIRASITFLGSDIKTLILSVSAN